MEILIKPWEEAKDLAFKVRQAVFIHEQGVPAEMELDEFDASASHALACQDGCCVGTGRLVNTGANEFQIGRMAVLAAFRNQGVGKTILKKLIEVAHMQGAKTIVLHAQLTAIPFYEKLGFQAHGPAYDEAGIAHRNMILLLDK